MTLAIIQARMGSSRLPGKVLKKINGVEDIRLVYNRIVMADKIDEVCVATSIDTEDDELFEFCEKNNIPCKRGSNSDVLGRYYKVASEYTLSDDDLVVRVTGDCPLIDPQICDEVVALAQQSKADYVSNTLVESFPDGLDCEVLRFSALKKANLDAKLDYEREHVTQYIIKNPNIFTRENLKSDIDLSDERWTLDEPEDLLFINEIYEAIGKELFFMKDVLKVLDKNPELRRINSKFQRNEGLIKSKKESGVK